MNLPSIRLSEDQCRTAPADFTHSGVQWIGVLPNHWNITSLRHVCTCLDSRRIPLNSEERSRRKGPFPYWGANGIVDHIDDWLFDEPLVLVGEDGAPFLDQHRPVAFSVSGRIWVNNHIHVLRPRRSVAQRFLTYVLNVVEYAAYIGGSTRDKLTQGDLKTIPVQLPPLEEQRGIASFLDRETEKIDTLIEKKRRLLELLGEKRTALITRAVTQGLDPDVRMKDSGVEWLGKIPEHWECIQLRRGCRTAIAGPFGSSLTKEMYGGEKYRVYGQQQVILGNFSRGDYYIPKETYRELRRFSVESGDLLISCMGTVGRAAVVPSDAEPGIINPRLVRLRLRERLLSPTYVRLVLRSSPVQHHIERMSRGGTMGGLNLSIVSQIRIPVPPRNEQTVIEAHVAEVDMRLNRLIDRTTHAISLLKEYRTALISAAVTGKIDVTTESAA